MSNAIDYIALQKSKAIQYMVAEIRDESRIKNLSPADTVELAIIRGMEYQKKLDEIDNPEPGADYFAYQGYHPPKDPPLDEEGYPYYGIVTKNILKE